MPLDPISTVHPVTGAIRPVTPSLLAETYLCPRPAPFEDSAAILEAKTAPWANSLEVAPESTVAAASKALRELIHAAPALDPTSVEVGRLPEGRARFHLTALCDIWRDLGNLPEDLAPLAHALAGGAGHALDPLPLLRSGSRIGATSADLALADMLERHHGGTWQEDAFPGLRPAGSGTLRAFQAGDTSEGTTLSITSLRDPLDELRFAAARAQRLLDEAAVESADEIGLLLPDDPAWLIDAEAVFAAVGLRLGGLPGAPARNRAAEAVHLILAVLNKPAPGMAAVALEALGVGTRDSALRSQLNRHPITGGDLGQTLRAIANHLPADIAAALRGLPCGAEAAPVDWHGLIAITRPAPTSEAPVTASRGAIAVFTEGRNPWCEVRRLLALGFAGDHYPSVTGSGPFWLEHEIDLIERTCGIALPGRRASLELASARLDRQLAAVSDAIEITVPIRDRAGDRLAPAAALDMLAHRVGLTAETLIQPLSDDAAYWPCDSHLAAPSPGRSAPETRILDLGRDLTGLRLKNGAPCPQSPSRLEKLLVSPLAWLLSELGIEDRSWGPDELGAMVRGSLMHKVLEALFPPGPPPDPATVGAAVPAAIDAAIEAETDLRFLAASAWAVERRHVTSDLTRIATRWAEMLREADATIHTTEEYLTGEAFGMGLNGKADTVLKLPNGRLLVIDYKSGTSKKRVKRMQGGWDVQAQLYGDMIAGTELAEGGTAISVGYLNLTDMVAVTRGTLVGEPFGPVDTDTHAEANAKLSTTVAELREGRVVLNTTKDAAEFDKLGIDAYALDNPLVAAFLWEDEE
ncbi:PD-(D/E)XK nuclease family protein [Roseivivax marinus]|uniref:PD-(D/E)XK nuclease family protein n=1 Tax=Roseivivax marinus TaxID=1379903 RepID=UPI00273DEC9C|nr:PD-(D/E)XK nuclease family protein [Roseivivax marinus]